MLAEQKRRGLPAATHLVHVDLVFEDGVATAERERTRAWMAEQLTHSRYARAYRVLYVCIIILWFVPKVVRYT